MMSNLARKRVLGLAALAICWVPVTDLSCPAQAPAPLCLHINSSGRPIPTIFWGLRPDPRFAIALSASSRQTASLYRQASIPRFQDLVYSKDCPRKSLLSVALAQSAPCNGYYMEGEYLPCTLSCGGHSRHWFSSTASEPCNGYEDAGDACNGCQLNEQWCDPCID
jgi:hypothetical protein